MMFSYRHAASSRYYALFIVLLMMASPAGAKREASAGKPKIVVGIVVDQMRWDYLYRYYSLYGDDGFKRLMKEGYNCQNTMIDYLPSYTAPGHTCIYTGSVPAIHGISGNNWVDNRTGREWYCVEDTSVRLVGGDSNAPSMSPRNLLTTTITDELRLATNFRSRVYGVALKDRGSILPAGHLANAAYWYDDKTGTFTTSTYYNYKEQSPVWLEAFNKRHVADSLVKLNWNLLYDPSVYRSRSTDDANKYEAPFSGEKTASFPHLFDKLSASEQKSMIRSIPAGNTYTLMMARACMDGTALGLGDETDFMAISLSSTDYVGHRFGPNSMEVEDMYLRLDKDIADFLNYMDDKYGSGNYLLFLSADHGGAHNATLLEENNVPGGVVNAHLARELNTGLRQQFSTDSLVRLIDNNQVYLDYKKLQSAKLEENKVKDALIQQLNGRPEILYVVDMANVYKTQMPEAITKMIRNGYSKERSGIIQLIFNAGWYDNGGKTTGTTHGNWNPYDTHIPLLWYGTGIKHGENYKMLTMKDITPTIASLLHIQMPSGCVGSTIVEIMPEGE